MERIDCAYEMLSDPALLSLLHGSIAHVPCSPNVECVLQRKQVPWVEWPEGTFFPQWRPPPPGAWPPKPEHDAPQEDPPSQKHPRNCGSRWETPTYLHQPKRKLREQKHEVSESEVPPCPHPRLRRAEKSAVLEVDILKQWKRDNPAPLSTQWPEPPWPWLKQRPRK
ncbi:hypothetical protein IG631_19637 [Alternaria alternata]|nr:hypothetical protein IG631_19637 [Alternaria alternata]